MDGLIIVIHAVQAMQGERYAPELPLPISVLRDYAARHRFSEVFVSLMVAYDSTLMSASFERRKPKKDLIKPHGSPNPQ